MSDHAIASPAARLLSSAQVAKRYCVATRTIRRWEAQGRIPRAVRITRTTVRWREEDNDRHLASLKP